MSEAVKIIEDNKTNDFAALCQLKKAGYECKTTSLINAVTESSYRLDVSDQKGNRIASAVYRSEEGSRTMLVNINEN